MTPKKRTPRATPWGFGLHQARILRPAEDTEPVAVDQGGRVVQERLDRVCGVIGHNSELPSARGRDAEQLQTPGRGVAWRAASVSCAVNV